MAKKPTQYVYVAIYVYYMEGEGFNGVYGTITAAKKSFGAPHTVAHAKWKRDGNVWSWPARGRHGSTTLEIRKERVQ